MSPFVYLASQSPRRAQLLDQLKIAHQRLHPIPGEDVEALESVQVGESPQDYVIRVTQAKLSAALQRWTYHAAVAAPILCADTTVALGATIFGKPDDADDARRILKQLRGQMHQVLTAVAVVHPQWPLQVQTRLSISQVTMAPVGDEDIDAYIASGEPFGKAGAYAIQSQAAAWVQHIEGSYSGIMGLPLYETAELLRPYGLLNTPGW